MTQGSLTSVYRSYDNFGAEAIFGRVLPHQLRTAKPTLLSDNASEFGVVETTFNYTSTPTVFDIEVGWNYDSVPLVMMWHLGYVDTNQNSGVPTALGKVVNKNALHWNKDGLLYEYTFSGSPSGQRTEYTYYIVFRQDTGLEGTLL